MKISFTEPDLPRSGAVVVGVLEGKVLTPAARRLDEAAAGAITRALAAISSEPLGGPPQALTEVIKADVAKWAPIVKSLNLQTD